MSAIPRAFALSILIAGLALVAVGGCGSEDTTAQRSGGPGGAGGGGRGPGGGGNWGGAATPAAAVPVQVAAVERRAISSFIETNGTLEAENEVDVVARISAPIVDLLVEEGMAVAKDQVLARLDDVELRSAVEVSRVNLTEARLAYERDPVFDSLVHIYRLAFPVGSCVNAGRSAGHARAPEIARSSLAERRAVARRTAVTRL